MDSVIPSETYGYAGNAPTIRFDPLGLSSFSDIRTSVTGVEQFRKDMEAFSSTFKKWKKKSGGSTLSDVMMKELSAETEGSVGKALNANFGIGLEDIGEFVEAIGTIPSEASCQAAIKAVVCLDCDRISKQGQECAETILVKKGSAAAATVYLNLNSFFGNLNSTCQSAVGKGAKPACACHEPEKKGRNDAK